MCRCAFSLLLVVSFMALFTPALANIDMSSWEQVHYDVDPEDPQANWNFTDGGTIAIQTLNADPTLLLDSQDLNICIFAGTFIINSTVEDDFIGIAFGYQDESHFYFLSWKEVYQNQDGWIGEEGFVIKKISAASPSDLTYGDFWATGNTANSELLASNTGDNTGWNLNTEYQFHLFFDSGDFTLNILEGSTVLWDITVDDGSYTSGRVGLYNFSQDEAEYTTSQILPDPIPTLSEWGMLIMGLLLLMVGTVAVVRKRIIVRSKSVKY